MQTTCLHPWQQQPVELVVVSCAGVPRVQRLKVAGYEPSSFEPVARTLTRLTCEMHPAGAARGTSSLPHLRRLSLSLQEAGIVAMLMGPRFAVAPLDLPQLDHLKVVSNKCALRAGTRAFHLHLLPCLCCVALASVGLPAGSACRADSPGSSEACQQERFQDRPPVLRAASRSLVCRTAHMLAILPVDLSGPHDAAAELQAAWAGALPADFLPPAEARAPAQAGPQGTHTCLRASHLAAHAVSGSCSTFSLEEALVGATGCCTAALQCTVLAALRSTCCVQGYLAPTQVPVDGQPEWPPWAVKGQEPDRWGCWGAAECEGCVHTFQNDQSVVLRQAVVWLPESIYSAGECPVPRNWPLESNVLGMPAQQQAAFLQQQQAATALPPSAAALSDSLSSTQTPDHPPCRELTAGALWRIWQQCRLYRS